MTFGDKAAAVTAASATQLSVTVPQGLPADDKPQHKVRVKTRGSTSNTLFFRIYMGPRVASFEPDVAMPGDVVKVVTPGGTREFEIVRLLTIHDEASE